MSDGWTVEKRSAFLAALAEGNSVAYAAKAGGIGRSTAYEYRKSDQTFADEWDAAVEAGTDQLEDIAIKRASEGSDVLLIFMLKARRKAVYAELSKHWVTGKDDKPIQSEDVTPQREPITTLLATAAARRADDPATKH